MNNVMYFILLPTLLEAARVSEKATISAGTMHDKARNHRRRGSSKSQSRGKRRIEPPLNLYTQVEGVGGFGGSCTCPDGQTYQVGDNLDDCGSLACHGGVPGTCERENRSERMGFRVICSDSPRRGSSKSESRSEGRSISGRGSISGLNLYTQTEGVGGFGGWCTCPDGQRYQVGDNLDDCGSLACEGGVPGDCEREIRPERMGFGVTCEGAFLERIRNLTKSLRIPSSAVQNLRFYRSLGGR